MNIDQMINIELISVLVAVVAVGVGLAGLMLASWRGVRQEMRDMRSHMERIDSHIGELRERMGHVEELLKGLRDAFVRRAASD